MFQAENDVMFMLLLLFFDDGKTGRKDHAWRKARQQQGQVSARQVTGKKVVAAPAAQRCQRRGAQPVQVPCATGYESGP